MTAESEQAAAGGLSRRQLLTRGAIAGGLIWAAPVIRTTAAYATTSNGTERPCTNFFFVVIEASGAVHPGPNSLAPKDIPPAIRQWFIDNPSVPADFPRDGTRPQLTQASDNGPWAVLLPEVTGPNAAGRQCRMVVAWGAAGKDFAEGYVDPNPPIAVEAGRRLLFPCPTGDDHHGGDDGDDEDDDDHGCKNGHDDGDHDEDDIGCDANATLSGSGTSGSLTADGGGSSPLGSDGSASTSISADGRPSRGGDHGGGGKCLSRVYLIYCCPR